MCKTLTLTFVSRAARGATTRLEALLEATEGALRMVVVVKAIVS
jgi:hypothetical protein